jgi:hypothetical protein
MTPRVQISSAIPWDTQDIRHILQIGTEADQQRHTAPPIIDYLAERRQQGFPYTEGNVRFAAFSVKKPDALCGVERLDGHALDAMALRLRATRSQSFLVRHDDVQRSGVSNERMLETTP